MTPVPTEPVHLVEDSVTGDRLLIYGTDKGIKIELRYDGDTLWITQAQIAELFGRDVSTISRYINNIMEEGKLTEESSLKSANIHRQTSGSLQLGYGHFGRLPGLIGAGNFVPPLGASAGLLAFKAFRRPGPRGMDAVPGLSGTRTNPLRVPPSLCSLLLVHNLPNAAVPICQHQRPN
jgi:hypothetical protein